MRAVVRRRLSSGAIVSVPLLWTPTFLFVPYLIMFVPAFQVGNYLTIVSGPKYYQILIHTFKIASIVATAALLVAYPLTYFLVFQHKSRRLRVISRHPAP